jgi:hypothetical protein
VLLGSGAAGLVVTASEPGDALARRVRDLLAEWDADGRPGDADLEIRAYERGLAPAARAGEVALEQRWTTFVLRWG